MLETFFLLVIRALEVIGVTIIIIGVVMMMIHFVASFFKKTAFNEIMTEIRMELSNYLILCLEVFIGRDIIETLLNPSMNDIIILVVLVTLRTVLAFFLNYEMTHIKKKQLTKLFDKKA